MEKEIGEVFTPLPLVIEIVKELPDGAFGPGRTVLDPACGNGQFLAVAKYAKMLIHGMSEEAALAELYGVDIMRDNVDICRTRLGGGMILMGDTLKPERRLEGQTNEEWALMSELFSQDNRQQQLSV